MNQSKLQRGIYEHYKKKYYEVIDIARHSETLEELVCYRMLEDSSLWVRPLTMFLESVEVNGHSLPRFKFISSQSAQDFFSSL